MREVNKMLKQDFSKLQSQFEKLGQQEADYAAFEDDRRRGGKERKKMRYYSSDEEMDEVDSQGRFDHHRLDGSSQIIKQDIASRQWQNKNAQGRSKHESDKENLRASNLVQRQY